MSTWICPVTSSSGSVDLLRASRILHATLLSVFSCQPQAGDGGLGLFGPLATGNFFKIHF